MCALTYGRTTSGELLVAVADVVSSGHLPLIFPARLPGKFPACWPLLRCFGVRKQVPCCFGLIDTVEESRGKVAWRPGESFYICLHHIYEDTNEI